MGDASPDEATMDKEGAEVRIVDRVAEADLVVSISGARQLTARDALLAIAQAETEERAESGR